MPSAERCFFASGNDLFYRFAYAGDPDNISSDGEARSPRLDYAAMIGDRQASGHSEETSRLNRSVTVWETESAISSR
jgi:hypothetical protein